MSSPSFAELIGLMTFGAGSPDCYVGEVSGNEVSEQNAGPYGYRVYRRGLLVRRESLDGRVQVIDGAQARWVRGDDETMTVYDRGTHMWASPIGGLDVGGERPSWSRWDGTDFTRLTGSVDAVDFLGRPAWRFQLAPPSHKPYQLEITVDAATGLVMRTYNAGFGSYCEWTSLTFDAELPDELFVWSGPSKAPDDRRAEHERELAERRRWFAARGLNSLPLTVQPELMPNAWDDDSGAFEAHFATNVHGALLRRPVSTNPWAALDGHNWPFSHRWSDGHWDWFIGAGNALSDDELRQLRDALAATT